MAQRLLAELIRVDHAVLCEFNDSLGDYFVSGVRLILKVKGGTCYFECDTHEAPSLRVT